MCRSIMSQPHRSDFAPEGHPAARSEWSGFLREDFTVDGRPSLLVYPKISRPGRPWIWRTQFFGVSSVDLALLEKGFHVAFMDLPNMYGGPMAMSHMDHFYSHATGALGLSPESCP